MSEELDDLGFVTNARARKALSDAGYDTLGSVLTAGEDKIVGGVKYVSSATWQEIEAEAEKRGLERPSPQIQASPGIHPTPEADRINKLEADLRTVIDFLRGHPVELP